MSSRLSLSKPSISFYHQLSLCFLLVLKIAPNSLAAVHSHIAAFCWVYLPWMPFPAPCGSTAATLWKQYRAQIRDEGGPDKAGLMSPHFCLLRVVWAAKGSWGSWKTGSSQQLPRADFLGLLLPALMYHQAKQGGSCWSRLGAVYLCPCF